MAYTATETLGDILVALKAILNAVTRPMGINPANGRSMVEVLTLPTLAAVSNVTSINQVAGIDATLVVPCISRNCWANNIRGRIT
jgi:hypothetical protein